MCSCIALWFLEEPSRVASRSAMLSSVQADLAPLAHGRAPPSPIPSLLENLPSAQDFASSMDSPMVTDDDDAKLAKRPAGMNSGDAPLMKRPSGLQKGDNAMRKRIRGKRGRPAEGY